MNGTKRICSAAAIVLAASMAPAAFAQSALQRLPELNVDPSQVSVSGLGWGGAMAIQVGVAHSSRIMGVAAFAAFPYDCERRGGVTPRLCAGLEGPDVIGLVANARAWFGHEIDAQEHLRRQRIFLYAGVNDVTIGPQVVAATHAFYQALIPAQNISFDPNGPGGHFLPMDYYDPRSTYWPCQTATSPRNWPVDCAYDGAGKSLAWIYGDLAPRTASLDPGGDLIMVNQGEFVARDFGMDDIAFLYVPKACAPGGSVCRLHVFLHDRDQSFFARNDTVFAERSG
ncbi:MAG: hypothetical protein IT518_06295, partial [Burkholderiales bacterium]|nr:hypothetical protein [Burkholderiales bacterium]